MSLSDQDFQVNRLDLLSRLAGDISHEIKNPLHAMVINLELVRRKIDKGEPDLAIERVAIIEDEIRKVHALSNALLEALRPPRDSHTVSGVSAVLQELMPLVSARARLARVELEMELDPAPIHVPLAAHDLRLLLLNLADRAVRTAGPGGSIAIRVAAAPGEASLRVGGSSAPVDDAERAWLDGPAARSDSIELGLRVVRSLVESAGGRIEIPAGNGDGAFLAIFLPRAGAA